MDNRPIGMFDSGIGGITVFQEIVKHVPNEDITYIGDTKNFPYGSKSKEAIIELSKKCVERLIEKNVKLIVIACGTATSQSLEELQKIYAIPIIGIIQPTVEELYQRKYSNIGIIATRGTIQSNVWEKKIKEKLPQANVINQECPLLAPMAEEGWTTNQIAKLTVHEYMKPFIQTKVDSLILGCTHYPLFKQLIQEELGKKVEIINTGEQTAKYVKKYLIQNKLEQEENHTPDYKIYLTDSKVSNGESFLIGPKWPIMHLDNE